MNKQEIVDRIYEIFGKYTLNGKLDACPCGCISEEEERKIYSKPLKELTEEDLIFYARKAMTTWGNLSDYKHFLPRILETYSQKENGVLIDLQVIYNKLQYGNWTEWEENEQFFIITLIKSNWIESVNQNINNSIYSEFCDYSYFLNKKELIDLWDYPKNKIAMRNFVGYFYDNANYLIDKNYETDLSYLLSKPNLVEEIEKEFFRIDSEDEKYSSELSVVLQMIERIQN